MTDQFDRLTAALADRYAIERELGSGGMATVYLAEDLKHHRKVAVKVLRPELAAVLGAERFVQEITTTANLQHPHILPLHDSGEADGFVYYVMPYVEGESLRDKLNREKQLAIDEAVKLTEAVASALDYAHRHAVIHRDIKPANILLHDGQPVVADFGIALAVSAAGGERLTETGLSLGTPEYMSPEQATADRVIDARSDIYSLGCVVYEMLAGEPPHTGPTVQAVIAKVLAEEPRRVTLARKTVPPHVELAVHKALAKVPADRFATASDFVAVLTKPSAVVVPPVAAAPPPGDTMLARLVLRHRWLGWVIPLSLAVLAGTAVWGWLRPTPAPRGSLVRFEVPFPSSGQLAPFRGHAVALSPDGAHVAYLGQDERELRQLYLRPLDQLGARPIPGTEGAVDPFFSPDGRWIGFGSRGGLAKVPLGGGPRVTIVERPRPRGPGGASWGADDMIVFGSSTGLWRVPAEGGTAEQLSTLNPGRGELGHRWPELLPSGRGVLFTIWTGSHEEAHVAVLSLATGEVTSLFAGTTPRYSETGHLIYGRADGVLMAVPFDPARLEVTGPGFSLLEGVMVKPTGLAEFGLSRTGSLVYLTVAAAGRGVVVMVDRNGEERSLIELPDVFYSPRFSPDGTRLALGIGQPLFASQVWIYEMAQGTLTPLTFEGNNMYPVWSWDGERVAFASDRAGLVDLHWRPADGSGIAASLLTAYGMEHPASWSRDGRYLIYRQHRPVTGWDIWVLPLEGDREPWAFTQTSAHVERSAVLSPDGRWLAYVSDLSGRNEVYVNSFPEPGGRRQVSLDGGTEPVWSPDGRELFYRNGPALLVAAVETTPDFRVRSRQLLFQRPYAEWVDHSNYDVHPDGERFVMMKPVEEEASSARLVVVLNWFEELRRRSGSGAP